MAYVIFVVGFSLFMIYRVGPVYGKTTPIVYISICSLVGSISVMFIKGFGLALRLTLAGNNQLTHISTYVFALVVGLSIAVQMNYFNKALDLFSTNLVNPIYYVFFTTATSIASIIFFQGFEYAGGIDTVSLIAGYIVIFVGVYLLNDRSQNNAPESGIRTGPRSSHTFLETRQSMSLGNRLSIDDMHEDNMQHLPLTGMSPSSISSRQQNALPPRHTRSFSNGKRPLSIDTNLNVSASRLKSPGTPGKSALATGRGAHRNDHVVFEDTDEDQMVIGSDSDASSDGEQGRRQIMSTPPLSPGRR